MDHDHAHRRPQDTTALAAEVVAHGPRSAPSAHAELFERIVSRIHNFFRKSIWDPNEVDDCLQKTLLLIEESLKKGTYDPTRSFNTWLWLKAHTVFAQWCRERERRPASLQAEPVSGRDMHAATDRALDAAEVLRRVQRELGDETYEIFCLYYEGGLSQEEVSQAVGRDRGTVRKRIADAHALIDRLLGEA